MKIKIIYLLFLLIFVSVNLISLNEVNKKIIKDIFNEYEKMLNKKGADKELKKIYNYINIKKNNKEILFLENGKSNNNIFDDIYFSPNENEIPSFIISSKMLDNYNKNKVIILSALFHRFKMAYDYLNDPGVVKIIQNDAVEWFLYNMDYLYVESLLINELIKNGFKLQYYQETLIKSNNEDQLSKYSSELFSLNSKVVYKVNGLTEKFFNKNDVSILKDLEIYGKKILSDYMQSKSISCLIDMNSYSFIQKKCLSFLINKAIDYSSILNKDGSRKVIIAESEKYFKYLTVIENDVNKIREILRKNVNLLEKNKNNFMIKNYSY